MTSALAAIPRTLAAQLPSAAPGSQVRIEGWVHRRRDLGVVTFLIVQDRSGLAQVVVRDPEARQSCGAAVRRPSSRSPAWARATRLRRAAPR